MNFPKEFLAVESTCNKFHYYLEFSVIQNWDLNIISCYRENKKSEKQLLLADGKISCEVRKK